MQRRVGGGGGGSGGLLSNNNTDIIVENPAMSSKNAKPVMAPLSLETNDPSTSSSAHSREGGGGAEGASDRTEVSGPGAVSVSLEERYETEKYNLKVKHWKESPFAVGLTEVTWQDEKNNRGCCDMDNNTYPKSPQMRDPTGCLCISAMVCSMLGANRVGNMIVLKQSVQWEEIVDIDEETGEEVTRKVSRPKLDIVMGPYWPMLVCVTYPLILGISIWTFLSVIVSSKVAGSIALLWAVCTMTLILALSFTACRDPGILYRHHKPPKNNNTDTDNNTAKKNSVNAWRWNDQALTYRPRGATYDPDTAVVIEEFDHTCPWTGTAIGKKNMLPFQFFVCFVFVCMVLDILLLAGVWN